MPGGEQFGARTAILTQDALEQIWPSYPQRELDPPVNIINSIQRGVTLQTEKQNTDAVTNVTIDEVDVEKAMVSCFLMWPGDSDNIDHIFTHAAELTSPTNLRLRTSMASSSNLERDRVLYWEVVEYG